ncbi:MAG: hypothetical protein P8Z30_17460 [Acidobacteriota bacterium]
MRRRAYVYFVLIFILGIMVGGAGMYTYAWYTGRWHHRFSRHRVIKYLQQQLDLSQTQTQQLQQILHEMNRKETELRKQIDPQFRAIREEARNETRKILNQQQVQKFNAMVKKWDEARRGHGHRRPPPPPPPPR